MKKKSSEAENRLRLAGPYKGGGKKMLHYVLEHTAKPEPRFYVTVRGKDSADKQKLTKAVQTKGGLR